MSSAKAIAAMLQAVAKEARQVAMQRAVLIVEAEGKREAPVKTGNLRRTITSRVEDGGNRGIVGTNARYARAVHDGSKAHTIRPVNGKALYWKGAKHPVKSVKHPGTKGNPFFERAIAYSRSRVEQELASLYEGKLGGAK